MLVVHAGWTSYARSASWVGSVGSVERPLVERRCGAYVYCTVFGMNSYSMGCPSWFTGVGSNSVCTSLTEMTFHRKVLVAFLFFLLLVLFLLLRCEQLVGSPTAEEVTFIANEGARKFILEDIPVFERQPLRQIFPALSEEGADLAQRMLVFDPRKRITGETLLFCR